MILKRHVLICVLAGLMTIFCITIHASEKVKVSSSYDKNGVTILFFGVAYEEVQKFILDKKDVTNELRGLIDEGIVITTPEGSNGFSLFFPLGEQGINIDKKILRKYVGGQFTVVLQDETTISDRIAVDTIPIEKGLIFMPGNKNTSESLPRIIGGYGANCGSYSSPNNPYPCCDNDFSNKISTNDGNCTWWAWKMVNEKWGINLRGWGSAPNWASNAKSDGYIVLDFPVSGTVASSSSGYGHVAYVTGYSASNVAVTEMNCGINSSARQGTSYTYPTTKFNTGYITPLQLKDFWIKSTSITPSASTVYSNFYLSQNFDAQFKVVNRNVNSAFYVQQFRVAVHKADNNLTWVRDFTTKGSALTGGYGNTFTGGYALSLFPWIKAGATFESSAVYTYFNSSEKGNYYIIPKMMINNKWVNLGKQLVTVR
ncbi:CHAP domain-containing protein [Methylovulum psychrotolerans]|uniref:Peptidase C51 domain-containing protein n=1 Tax=Methylovulum psychrotolerans TaxID=1704499 RepID=A0A2S5CIX6_9GAMM|nr:CHAP domain-containing protein [Methylovulum psychrotolerans]POZ50707.1 hypothetical protein AADEFJLK_03604 [Methylovulum psychrotolerans]